MSIDGGANFGGFGGPAGGAGDGGNLKGCELGEIFGSGGGRGEVDSDLNVLKILVGDRGGACVGGGIEAQRDFEAVLGCELFDHAAHLSVANDGELCGLRWGAHRATSPAIRRRVSDS